MNDGKSEQLTAEQLAEEVAKVLTSWPLYRTLSYKGQAGHTVEMVGINQYTYGVIPRMLSLHCPKCSQETLWECNSCKVCLSWSDFREKQYTCRNCGQRHITYFFLWGLTTEGGVLFKVGQSPPLSHEPPKELGKALDQQDEDYYTKALDCRNFNYGLGAVAYLRRIVEKRMNDLLDLLADVAAHEGSSKNVIGKIAEAKASPRAEERVEIVNTLLPDRLKAGGHNPFSYIYDVMSCLS